MTVLLREDIRDYLVESMTTGFAGGLNYRVVSEPSPLR